MRIFFYKIVKFSFIFFVYFYSFALSIENKIILKINNQIITKLDIYQEANYLKALNPNINNLEEIKILEIAQSSLVREKIKEIELLKYNKNKINKEYLQEILQSIYTKIGLRNMNEFKQYIGTFGISIQIIEKKLKTEAHWNQLIYNKFYSKLKIDKKMIRENMKTTKRDTSTSYHLYEILFNLENDINSEDLFKNIEKSIHENGFENAASIYSISETSRTGGNLGWVNENNINDKISKKINNLKIGEHTEPILLPGGFLILKLKDKKSIKKKIDLEKEINLKIRSLQNQQLNQYSNIYFKKIKKNILINEK